MAKWMIQSHGPCFLISAFILLLELPLASKFSLTINRNGNSYIYSLVAVMLGVLRVDVDTYIKEYLELCPEISPLEKALSGSKVGKIFKAVQRKSRFDPAPMELAIKRLIAKHVGTRSANGENTSL
jgi:hypothetical protein